jgi:hypothetical protein
MTLRSTRRDPATPLRRPRQELPPPATLSLRDVPALTSCSLASLSQPWRVKVQKRTLCAL